VKVDRNRAKPSSCISRADMDDGQRRPLQSEATGILGRKQPAEMHPRNNGVVMVKSLDSATKSFPCALETTKRYQAIPMYLTAILAGSRGEPTPRMRLRDPSCR